MLRKDDSVIYIVLFMIGICLGSFMHVIAYRVPAGSYWQYKRSRCERCNHELKALDLIPLFSYFLQRGQCRYCSKPIHPLHPISEILMGIALIICYLQSSSFVHFSFLLFVSMILLILSLADIYYLRLPNYFLLMLFILTLIWRMQFSVNWLGQLIYISLTFLSLTMLRMVMKQGMGMGDIKLISIFVLLFSFHHLIWLIFLSCLSALIFILGMIIIGYDLTLKKIPFGPFLCSWAFIFLTLN